jgi:hypothetical protein
MCRVEDCELRELEDVFYDRFKNYSKPHGVRGGHRHLQIGRMLDIDLISEPPHAPSPQMHESKVWESVWPEGQEAFHS